ncbi:unnamed protein product, partial [Polarella glacialis]
MGVRARRFVSFVCLLAAPAVAGAPAASNWQAAQAALESGQLQEAEQLYLAALEAEPGSTEALNNLGVLAGRRGALEEADARYRRAAELEPRHGAFQANLGIVALQRGLWGQAAPSLRRAIALGQTAPQVHLALGSTLRQLSAFAEAEVVLRAILRGEETGLSPQMAADARAELQLIPSTMRSSDEGLSDASVDVDIQVFTAATSVATRTAGEPGLEMLLHSAEARRIGWAQLMTLRRWGDDFSIKLEVLADMARRAHSKDSLLLMVDAYDVVFSPTFSLAQLRKEFEALGSPIVLAAEALCEADTCAVAGGKTNSDPKDIGDFQDELRFLNSGLLLGRAGALLKVLERNPWQSQIPLDDQTWWGQVWQKETDLVVVDSARRLFSCPTRAVLAGDGLQILGHHSGELPSAELRLRAGQAVQALGRDGLPRSEPLLLHFPGRSRPLLRPAYATLFPDAFSARGTAQASEPSGALLATPPMKLQPKLQPPSEVRVVGTPLREGPWRCTRKVLPDDQRAALCSGGKVVVDQVYVANLESRPDRLRAVAEEFERVGLRAARFPSVPANSIPRAEQERHDKSALRGIPKGHLACFLTHLALWREVLAKGWESAWIFEDDAVLVDPELRHLAQRVEELRGVDAGWHMAYTGRNPVSVSRALLLHEQILHHWPDREDRYVSPRIVDPGTSEGLWGYLLSARGAAVLVPIFEEMLERGITHDVDLALHLAGPRAALRLYAFEPTLSGQAEADTFSDTSDISRGRKQLLLGHQFLGGGRFAEAEVRLRSAVLDLEGIGRQSEGSRSVGGRAQRSDADVYLQEALRYLAASLDQQTLRSTSGSAATAEAEAAFRRAVEMAEQDGLVIPRTALWGSLADFCYFLSSHGRHGEAAPLCQRSLQLSREAQDADGQCAALEYLGILHGMKGEVELAEQRLREAVAVARGEGPSGGAKAKVIRLCSAYTNLCIFFWQQTRLQEAEEACQSCVDLGQGMGARGPLEQIQAERRAAALSGRTSV